MVCLQCSSQFEPNSRRHVYCNLQCWQMAGGRILNDISDLSSRQCVQCGAVFTPNTRLHRYCGEKCADLSKEALLPICFDEFYQVCFDDQKNLIKEKCLDVARMRGYTDIVFNWWWAEYNYLNHDDKLLLKDLPKC